MLRLTIRVGCQKWHRQSFNFGLNSGPFLWCKSMPCRDDSPLPQAPFTVGRILFVVEHLLVFLKDRYLIFKRTKHGQKSNLYPLDSENDLKILENLALIPIKLSRPDPKKVYTWQPPRTLEWVSVS